MRGADADVALRNALADLLDGKLDAKSRQELNERLQNDLAARQRVAAEDGHGVLQRHDHVVPGAEGVEGGRIAQIGGRWVGRGVRVTVSQSRSHTTLFNVLADSRAHVECVEKVEDLAC